MPDGIGILKGAKLRRAMIPFAAVAFLLAQLLVGFHHHETNKADGGLAAAECTLCLASHLPFDIAPTVALAPPTPLPESPQATAALETTLTAAFTRHTPRAPPAIS